MSSVDSAAKVACENALSILVGARAYEKLEFRRHLGYWPNLDNPKTFNEKICARKFHPLVDAPRLVDELEVRDYVASRVGGEFLTRLYYGGNRPEDVAYEALPPQFRPERNSWERP